MKVDYLIVGQGIAGSMLSYFLIKAGKNVLVVDDGHRSAASSVSLGLLNPITGRKLNLAWKTETLLPFAKKIYQEMEKQLGIGFYRETNSLRLFIDEKQQQRWQTKQDEPEIKQYIVEPINENPLSGTIQNPFGGVKMSGSAQVDNKQLLQHYRDYLIAQNAFQQASVDAAEIDLDESGAKWRQVSAAKIIFCDGYKAATNPFFDWLPFSPNKGEVLIVRIPDFDLDKIINRGFFIAPHKDDLFRAGATHNWKEYDNIPSEKGKEELATKLSDIVRLPHEIITHEAGVRPTSRDFRPIIGLHPKNPQLGIFSGLGSKGFSQAPYFAWQFAEYLQGRGKVDDEVKVERFL